MRRLERLGKLLVVLGAFIASGFLAHQFGAGGLWHGFSSPLAAAKPGQKRAYDLTRLEAVNETCLMSPPFPLCPNQRVT